MSDPTRSAPVDQATIQAVKAYKQRRLAAGAYRDQPELALILHSFNRRANIDQLIEGIRNLGEHELIVCEDGSLDGSLEKWISLLDRPNDFLIRSNDLHEIRILDRAIRFARSVIVCLIQDDDRIPRETAWLDNALEQFARHSRLAILGGFQAYEAFDPDPAKAKRIWGGSQFRFVHHVNVGPYFIRKSAYEHLGGWDYSFSAAGEPGIGFDNELCLRAWLGGYQVGYSFVPFKGPVGQYAVNGGTALFSDGARGRNAARNAASVYARYRAHTEQIDHFVAAANAQLRSEAATPAEPPLF